MADTLTSLATYGYIALFLYSLGGGFVALVAAGVLSYSGKMDIGISITVAFIANSLGDALLFYLARYHQSEFKHYLRKHRRKLALAHIMMKKQGSWIVLFQKFVYGIKTLIPIAIGLTRYSFIKFNILNIISAAIWAVTIGVASYLSGEAILKAYEYAVDKPYLPPLILFALIGGLWYYFHFKTKKSTKRRT